MNPYEPPQAPQTPPQPPWIVPVLISVGVFGAGLAACQGFLWLCFQIVLLIKP